MGVAHQSTQHLHVPHLHFPGHSHGHSSVHMKHHSQRSKFLDPNTRNAFQRLCLEGHESICASHLCDLIMEQLGVEDGEEGGVQINRSDRLARYKEAIRIFHARAPLADELPETAKDDINFGTFMLLMDSERTDLVSICGEDHGHSMWEIRQILLKEDATKKIHSVTNAKGANIYAQCRTKKTGEYDSLIATVNAWVGFFILLNAIIIGVSAELDPEWEGWIYVEIAFTSIFFADITLKLYVLGLREYYMGADMKWNMFDNFVVLLSLVDIALELVGDVLDLSSFAIIRVLRFARLIKLMRVLRLKVFAELRLLINGVFLGVRTLFWAVVLLGFFIYCLGVTLKQTIGMPKAMASWGCNSGKLCTRGQDHLTKYRDELFGTVGRAMFTVFRCFTDGCVSLDGTPLPVYLWDTFGPFAVAAYVLCILFVIFGLFNLIMAIFVESTMKAAKVDADRRRVLRQNEALHYSDRLGQLVVAFLMGQAIDTNDGTRSSLTVFNAFMPFKKSSRSDTDAD